MGAGRWSPRLGGGRRMEGGPRLCGTASAMYWGHSSGGTFTAPCMGSVRAAAFRGEGGLSRARAVQFSGGLCS